MRNSKFWRKRNLEDFKNRLAQLKAQVVYDKITSRENEERSFELANRLLKRMGMKIMTSPRKRIRRLARKVRRMERTEKLE